MSWDSFTNTPINSSSAIYPGSIATPSVSTPSSQTDPGNSTSSTPPSSTQPSSAPPPPSSTASTDFSAAVNAVFNATTVTIAFWLFTAYIIYKLGSAIFAPKTMTAESSGQLSYSRTIDITLSIVFCLLIFAGYYNMTPSEQTNITGYTIEWLYEFLNDPWSLLLLIWFTIILFFLVYILRVPTGPDVKPVLITLVEDHIWVFYALFGIIFFFKYVLGIQIVNILLNNSFTQYLENLPPYGTPSSSSPGSSSSPSLWSEFTSGVSGAWDVAIGDLASPAPAPAPSSNYSPGPSSSYSPGPATAPAPSPSGQKQVYNISQNKYTYKRAQELCIALDASLATYDQIEQAYNNGAEWCTYGWSAGQMAYFPTQKATYDRLAQNPNTKNACGRPGINGGYMANPNIRFGVNCYGVKPPAPTDWVPPVIGAPPAAAPSQSACEIKEDKKMAELRKNAIIAGFNSDEWSRY
jgi:hypothetical protein